MSSAGRQMSYRGRLLIAVAACGAVFGLFGWWTNFSFFRLSRVPQSDPYGRTSARQGGSGLESVAETLRRDNQLNGCRNVVEQLNTYQARHPEQRPPTVTEAERALLQKEFQLSDDELSEVGSTAFTRLDTHHLDMCLLLYDVARTLHLDGLPDRDRAAAAFAWTVRQVRLGETEGPPSPPQFVLRRGWGSPLERSLIFLALLDQLGIPGCMIALPDEKGPRYWLPGALANKEIYLFDPRLGLPVPGPQGEGTATLAQVRTQPDVLLALAESKEHPYDVTRAQAERAEPHVACTLSSLAPRMRYLQNELHKSGSKARLAVDAPAALRDFNTAIEQRAFVGCSVRTWSSPLEGNCSLRVLRAFLPPEEGGTDVAPADSRAAQWLPRRWRYELSLTPWQLLPVQVRALPENVDPGRRLRGLFAKLFVDFVQEPRRPHDLLLRGRFEEATAGLVAVQDEVQRQRAALQSTPGLEKDVVEWCNDARKAQADVLSAERLAASSKTPEAIETLKITQERLKAVWDKSRSYKVLLLLTGTAAEPLAAETAYQLALCKQELAEQAQAGFDHGKGRVSAPERETAWSEAATWWKKYRETFPNAPGNAAACFMEAEALERLGKPTAALELLKAPPDQWIAWDKASCRVRFRQLEERKK